MSVGLLTFNSDLTLNPGSITDIELGGTTPSLFDRISVDDTLTYGGTLRLSLVGDYNPQVGDSFQLFQDFNARRAGAIAGNSASELPHHLYHRGKIGELRGLTGTRAISEPGVLANAPGTPFLPLSVRDCSVRPLFLT